MLHGCKLCYCWSLESCRRQTSESTKPCCKNKTSHSVCCVLRSWHTDFVTGTQFAQHVQTTLWKQSLACHRCRWNGQISPRNKCDCGKPDHTGWPGPPIKWIAVFRLVCLIHIVVQFFWESIRVGTGSGAEAYAFFISNHNIDSPVFDVDCDKLLSSQLIASVVLPVDVDAVVPEQFTLQ